MGEVKQINIKNRTYYFYNDIINIKNLESKLLKIDKKNHTKTLVFTILDILQLKKLMIAKIFTVWILCICLLIMKTDILKQKMKINTWSLTLQMKIKSYYKKNTQMVGVELKTKSKQ